MNFRQFNVRSSNKDSRARKSNRGSLVKRRLSLESLEDRVLLHSSLDLDDGHSDDDHEIGVHGTYAEADGDGELVAAGGLNPLTAIPALHSNSSATVKIYLDFNGDFLATWGGYSNVTTPVYDIDGDATTFSDAELIRIQEIWARVAEDFAPFNVDVTTVDPGDFSNGNGLRVAIGGDGSWIGPYGGVAYVNSFTNSIANTVYVFSENLGNGYAKYTAEAVSHESGHAFGLKHQSAYDSGGNKTQEYYSGNSAWAPIIGNSYYGARSTWYNGPNSYGSTYLQDDIDQIARATNGFGYRTDDHGNSYGTATAASLSGTTLSGSGLVGRMSDQDYFSFSTGAGQITLNIDLESGITNLDSVLELRASDGSLITTIDPSNSFGATLTTTVAAGDYYLVVRSTGEYGSVGEYTISGQIQLTNVEDGNGGDSNADYTLAGGVLTVHGTAGNDIFQFAAGNIYTVTINGNSYLFNSGDVTNISFDGETGNDRVTLIGTAGREIARMRNGSVVYDGLGFHLTSNNIEDALANGSSEDLVYFYDTAGDETYLARPLWARMTGAGFRNTTVGFGTTVAYSTGGNDRAVFHDSSGNDIFYARPGYAYMKGPGYLNYVSGFDDVRAYATAGGVDRAYFFDSAGNDLFVGRTNDAYIVGNGFLSYANGFDRVYAYATAGGVDRALLHDSAGNDVFIARRNDGYMYGSGFFNYAAGFDRVYAFATAGGTDRASMYDSSANDAFVGRSYDAYMYNSGYLNYARGFDRVYAYATAGGTDRAVLKDSAGNDTLIANSVYSMLYGNGFYNNAQGFERVDAYATGGYDTARMYDSSANDAFIGRSNYGYMRGSNYLNMARGFERMSAYSNYGGADQLSVANLDYLFANYGSWS